MDGANKGPTRKGPKKTGATVSGPTHFAGDLDRNEVEIDLDKFLTLLQENQDLKARIKDMDQEYHRNPWKKWEHMAETLNAWRIIPRALMAFYMYMLYWATMWFTTASNFGADGPTDNQTTLITVLVGAGGVWFSAYCATGGKKTRGG